MLLGVGGALDEGLLKIIIGVIDRLEEKVECRERP